LLDQWRRRRKFRQVRLSCGIPERVVHAPNVLAGLLLMLLLLLSVGRLSESRDVRFGCQKIRQIRFDSSLSEVDKFRFGLICVCSIAQGCKHYPLM